MRNSANSVKAGFGVFSQLTSAVVSTRCRLEIRVLEISDRLSPVHKSILLVL